MKYVYILLQKKLEAGITFRGIFAIKFEKLHRLI